MCKGSASDGLVEVPCITEVQRWQRQHSRWRNGWLVGSWELDIHRYWAQDVSSRRLKGEAHFGWALEGRAIQDVWIMPRLAERTHDPGKHMNMYGTTLRVWDPSIKAWQITWTNPAGGHHERQIGRRSGKDIVQIGNRPDGTPTRWTFSEIAADSFHWTGEALAPDGRSWTLEGDFRARRIRPDQSRAG